MSRIYVAIDLETTGFSADRDAILEIGAVKFRIPTRADEEPVIERYTTLVNPGRPLPYRISRLTGITQEELDMAPTLPQVLDHLRQLVGNYPVVGHNVAFELAFLKKQALLQGQAHLDTFELASLLWPHAPRYSLGELALRLGVPFENWHRALADAEMTMHLFLALWRTACTLPEPLLEQIVRVGIASRWSLRSFFAAAQRAEVVGPLIALPALRQEPPHPSAPLQGVNTPAPIQSDEWVAYLESGSPVAQALPNFSERAAQKAMLSALVRAFNQERHLVVEGGTGAGKSLAYALAGIAEAQRRGESVVISTNTLNLQDQLYYQDLPRLAAALPKPFTVQRLKGRTNYLCARRLRLVLERGTWTTAEAKLLARVLIWQRQTTSGDRAELNLQREEENAWEQICGDASSCRPDLCGAYGICYWFRAHDWAEHAHLVIVNHALLLSDLAAGGGLIPEYQSAVIDEAHHLEEQATSHFGYSLSARQVDNALAALGHEERGKAAGILAQIQAEARASTHRTVQNGKVSERAGLLQRQVEQARASAALLFEAVKELIHHLPRQSETRYRLLPEWRNWAAWHGVATAGMQIQQEITALLEGVEVLYPSLAVLGATEPRWQAWLDELRRVARTIATVGAEIERILLKPQSNDVCWLTAQPHDDDEEQASEIGLHRAPISVATLLAERLFAPKRSIVLTSATLAVEGGFGYIRERLGIPRADELSVGSPYHYEQQVLTYIVNDLPEPNQPNYAAQLQRALVDLAKATQGRMLVLFTSKSQLSAAYRAISTPLARENIIVLGQFMDGSRTHLLERFQTEEKAVLLGTQSFWEGVDVPGPALSCVVITRLPFPVPTDPIHTARAENYGNAFNDYMVPQAVIRFRQGFGRLIRSETDHGVVAVLDSRLSSKSYADTFIHSLPTTALEIGPMRDLPPRAERWINQ